MSTMDKKAGDGRVDTVVVIVDDGVYDPYVGSSSATLVFFPFAPLGSRLLESNALECCCLWRDSREQGRSKREREREQKIAKETVSFGVLWPKYQKRVRGKGIRRKERERRERMICEEGVWLTFSLTLLFSKLK